MKRLLLSALAAAMLATTIIASATPAVVAPDFAYPQQVTKNSEKALQTALKTNNDVASLRALIDIALAQGMIDNDNLPGVYKRINDTAIKMKSPAARAMARLLQADILSSIYQNKQSRFDERQLPLSPLPDDWNEWSGDQFRDQIVRMIDEALSDPAALQSTPIADYSSILTLGHESEIYFPTLYDFVVNRAINLLSSNFESSYTLPINLLENIETFPERTPEVNNSPVASKILGLYADLMRFNKDRYAPYLYSLLNCHDFIFENNDNNYEDDSYEEAGNNFLKKEFIKYFPLTEYSGDILYEMSNDCFDSVKEYYATLSDFINRYPNYWRTDCFKSRQIALCQPVVSFAAPNYTSPGKSFIAKINNKNAKVCYFNIYRFDPNRNILLSSTPVFHQKIESEKEAPFSTVDSIIVTLPETGVFLAVISDKNVAPTGNNITRFGSIITCTSVALGSISGNKNYIYSFNPETGDPLGDVDLYTKKQEKEISLGKTDKNGLVEINLPKNNSYGSTAVYPRYNNDVYGIKTHISSQNKRQAKTIIRNISFCDLPIYHPDDSIQWETIVYSNDNESRRLISDARLRAILHNANYIAIDTLEVTTDEFGRGCGAFHLPSGELTGNYSIRFESLEKKSDVMNFSLTSLRFLVSDYKLPTFKVELLKNVMNTPGKGDVTVRGRVMTLSGVGLANTQVSIDLSASERFRFGYGNGGQAIYADSVITDADGSFSFVLKDNILNDSPFPKGFFTVKVSATSLSGESQQASTSFSRGTSYSIIASLYGSDYNNVFESSKPAKLSLRVYDAEGKEVDKPVKLTVAPSNSNDLTKGFTSIVTPDTKEIDLSSLTPGYYDFKFTMTDEYLKASSDSLELEYAVFRLNDSRSPSRNAVWGARNSHNTRLKHGEKARIIYAVPSDDSHLVYVLSCGDSIIETKWLKCNSGVHELMVEIPSGNTSAKVSLYGCRDFKSESFIEEISYETDTLKIECETFRDKLIPGTEETWSFHIHGTLSPSQRASLSLGMYNAALEKFNSSNWNLQFWSNNAENISSSFNIWNYNYYNNAIISKNKNPFSCPSLIIPNFETYGYPFVSRYRTARIFNKRMSAATGIAGVISEDMVSADLAAPQTSVLNSESYVVNALQGQVSGLKIAEEEDAGVLYESVVSAKSANEIPSQPDFEYREGNTALAFFRPNLTTDNEGRLTFTFNVPNENTTWKLNALTYTQDLLSASLSRTFIANKPVMVTPNLPRFLRAGDRATISSLVVNNSEETQTIVTTTEIFDPLSGNILFSSASTDTVAPGQNTTVNTTLDAPFDATAIGVRVKSATKLFADGEQSLLPILPSTNPVIESVPFYISPDSTHFEMQLPRIGDNARVTLEYCDNPAWYVVTALPGLSQQKLSTPSDAASAIFSAAVAEGILRDNPAIAEALRHWTASDRSDSTLTSMLQRNADLKTMLLQATPWMVDAMNDTQRMQRLALLFDRSEIADTYTRSIELLKRLQRSGGGWAWVTMSNDASQWATYDALMRLGRLNRLGYLPSDKSLNSMIQQALAWHQLQTEKDYRKYPADSYFSFVRLRDLWPQYNPSLTGKSIISKEIQNIVKNWKKFDVGKKAQAALLLAHNKYSTLARNVLASVYEFSKTSPTQGMWWPSVGEQYGGSMTQLQISAEILTALHQIDPDSKMISPIRQWLILQKEVRNWGSGEIASEVICSILQSSSKWVSDAGNTAISIGESPVPITYMDNHLGYVRTDISMFSPSNAELSISKSSMTPSWGAVYSQSVMTMSEIKSSSCEAVSIEKRLYKQQGTEWVEAKNLRVGDRVKIQLLIHADRDMQYIAIDDSRAACFEPVEQLPAPIYSQGLCFYRENRDASTNLFVTNMPRGTYMLEYEMWVNNAGIFSSGIATIQSQYAPQLSAHSAGHIITCDPNDVK